MAGRGYFRCNGEITFVLKHQQTKTYHIIYQYILEVQNLKL